VAEACERLGRSSGAVESTGEWGHEAVEAGEFVDDTSDRWVKADEVDETSYYSDGLKDRLLTQYPAGQG
jgi:hypothetical protein